MLDADAFVLLLPFVDVAIVIDPDAGIIAAAAVAMASAAIMVRIHGARESADDDDPGA
jgi:hypothetical protein